ncbi:MAG: SDR family NAD(P)-dependent oxidoreductase [Alphaproteobacteria bacterium]|nr:SDR family NAD(P)-dependent oxidoreductase [Alphaproteobacteria bacterium]MCY4231293.1 SDR family NAD(P)-dependent oxidoreductase [Alphaproteobacteria bacterium]MCY4318771.1 SDR family NAD(P)-dependent oxidoreductase [Alphaproteobacteria bacterium]
MSRTETAIIVGVGPGLGASLGRIFSRAGMRVALAARTPARLETLAAEMGHAVSLHACDATDETSVKALFAAVPEPDIVVFNASGRVRASVVDIETEQFEQAWRQACLGGFIVGREAARAMLLRGSGSIFFTGATASVKGYAMSAGFAVGKFGLRALAQSMARDYGPKGIHVAHFIIDGGILGPHHAPHPDRPEDHLLGPDSIAETYLHVHRQHRSAWAHELDLRPWVESF